MNLKIVICAVVAISIVAVSVVKIFDPFGDPFEPLEPVHHDTATVPKDRNPRMVEESLRRIDPCRLLRSAVRQADVFDGRTSDTNAIGLSGCSVFRIGSSYRWISMTLGEPFYASDRFDMRRTGIGGALAYVDWQCTVWLPVDFDSGISMYGLPKVTCPQVKAVAAAMAKLLRHPERVVWTERNASAWSACPLLKRALGKEADRFDLVMGDTADGRGFDGCQARGRRAPYPGRSLTVGKERHIVPGRRIDRIRGRTVRRDSIQASCARTWAEPALNDTAAGGWVTVDASTCAKATELARRAIAVLDSGPAPRYDPQRPILYRADQSALPVNGACIDVPPGRAKRCTPYTDVDVDVPDDPVQMIRHAEADPNVTCAMALDEVRTTFGPAMRPAVIDKGTQHPADKKCVFVEPTHEFQVWVDASATPLAESVSPSFIDDTINGHPAYDDDVGFVHGLHVALTEPDEPGQLTVAVSPGHDSTSERLQELTTILVENHF